MTLLRSFLYATAAAALIFLPACGSGSTEQAPSAAATSDLENGSLEDLTVLKGTVAQGGSVTVSYEPSDYDSPKGLPYVGVDLVRPTASPDAKKQISVTVHGDFPGLPRVLVVDAAFNVLASTTAIATENGPQANLSFVDTDGAKMVLVRDDLWVRPMDFQIEAGL